MARRTYVDNAYNRSIGRVGMPHGSAVVSRSSGSSYSSSSTSSSYNYGSSSGQTTANRGYASGSSVSSSGSNAARSTYKDNPKNRQLDRVGKPLGSCVQHRDGSVTRKDPSLSSAASSTSSSEVRTYKDNPTNRKLDRVNDPLGSCIQHKDGSVTRRDTQTKVSVYVDNAYNRRVGRVGKEKGSHIIHSNGTSTIEGKLTRGKKKAHERKQKVEDYVEDPSQFVVRGIEHLDLDEMAAPGWIYSEEQAAEKIIRLEEVQEKWSKRQIAPYTDCSKLEGFTCKEISMQEIEKTEKIGQGSFGEVYASVWKEKNTPVAYKRLLCQSLTKKKHENFKKEIELYSKLEHTNIVRMFGVVLEKNNIGIVMEFFKKTLFDVLFHYKEDELSPSSKHHVIDGVGSALTYLHTHQPPIAHCDVKSQNILLDDAYTAKVCDFGLSVIKSSVQSSCSSAGMSATSPGRGTPRYSAPEVLRGEILKLEGLIMSDIYSLALVVYEVVLEEEPFEDLNPTQLTKHVGYGNIRPPIELDNPNLSGLLTRCWSSDPKQRPDIQEFCKEWKDITIS